MGPHHGRAEGKENLPQPAAHTPRDAPQDPIGRLGSQGTLLAHGHPVVHKRRAVSSPPLSSGPGFPLRTHHSRHPAPGPCPLPSSRGRSWPANGDPARAGRRGRRGRGRAGSPQSGRSGRAGRARGAESRPGPQHPPCPLSCPTAPALPCPLSHSTHTAVLSHSTRLVPCPVPQHPRCPLSRQRQRETGAPSSAAGSGIGGFPPHWPALLAARGFWSRAFLAPELLLLFRRLALPLAPASQRVTLFPQARFCTEVSKPSPPKQFQSEAERTGAGGRTSQGEGWIKKGKKLIKTFQQLIWDHRRAESGSIPPAVANTARHEARPLGLPSETEICFVTYTPQSCREGWDVFADSVASERGGESKISLFWLLRAASGLVPLVQMALSSPALPTLGQSPSQLAPQAPELPYKIHRVLWIWIHAIPFSHLPLIAGGFGCVCVAVGMLWVQGSCLMLAELCCLCRLGLAWHFSGRRKVVLTLRHHQKASAFALNT